MNHFKKSEAMNHFKKSGRLKAAMVKAVAKRIAEKLETAGLVGMEASSAAVLAPDIVVRALMEVEAEILQPQQRKPKKQRGLRRTRRDET